MLHILLMAFSCSNSHNNTGILKMLERCNVSPPPNLVPTTSLPLTFFDIPWLLFTPSQSLFFYDSPQTTIVFTENTVPLLKHTLSLTLQQFFPFCGSLSLNSCPEVVYTDGDFVSLTVAESDADFNHLCSYNPRNALELHDFVPKLDPIKEEKKEEIPLMALRFTLFPGNGFCIGLCYRNVVGDGRTLDHFLKYWAYLSRLNGLDMLTKNKLLPCFDRSIITEPYGVKESFLNEWRELQSFKFYHSYEMLRNDLVRATYIISPKDMEKIKNYILFKWNKIHAQSSGSSLLLSPYVLVCALVWVSLMKARDITELDNDIDMRHYFGFVAGGITRLGHEVPINYFGNCVAFGRSAVSRMELLGEDGIVMAAKIIGDKIMELNEDVLGRVREWILDWEVLFGSEHHVTVSGSPKVDSYGLDFGWGRPRKIEDISIDKTGAISLVGGREKGDIEVGLSLPRNQMDIFVSTFTKALTLS